MEDLSIYKDSKSTKKLADKETKEYNANKYTKKKSPSEKHAQPTANTVQVKRTLAKREHSLPSSKLSKSADAFGKSVKKSPAKTSSCAKKNTKKEEYEEEEEGCFICDDGGRKSYTFIKHVRLVLHFFCSNANILLTCLPILL